MTVNVKILILDALADGPEDIMQIANYVEDDLEDEPMSFDMIKKYVAEMIQEGLIASTGYETKYGAIYAMTQRGLDIYNKIDWGDK